MICPCQNKQNPVAKLYADCCEPLHLRVSEAISPEQLMRSRYSAFFLALGQYIFDTQHPDFRNGTPNDYQQSAESTEWCGLEVLESEQESYSGKVNFKAYFIDKDKWHCLHEISNFVLENGHWLYTDGVYQPRKVIKISRNELCPCNSGLKAKKCHLS
ncbi:MAG: SEC-C domain-containing protein [Kangiellaceae bacterium]|nr:SEC-C domain-containing protein [Kangiellaceae bacterium]